MAGGVFVPHGFKRGLFFGGVGYGAHCAEHDGAAEIGGEFLRHDVVEINHAEGNMVVAREQLVFMACGRAVQDNFAFVVNIADRHGVGIAVVAV